MAKKTLEQLDNELAEALGKISDLNVQISTLSSENFKLTETNADLNREKQQLTIQVTTLQGRIEEMEGIVRQAEQRHTVLGQGFSEEQIREKINAGLSFDQAIEVLINQRTEDEANAIAKAAQ